MIENLISAEEVTRYLDISLPTLYKWIKTKNIPSYKIGSRVLFKKSELEKWIERFKI